MGTEDKETTISVNGVSLSHIPKLATGGIIEEPFEAMLSVGESFTTTFTLKFSKKSIRKLTRNLQRALLGSNNKRKRHGLPMYRKWA